MRNRNLSGVFPGLLLALVSACGGGSPSNNAPSPPLSATGLAYTDPTSTGWRLVRDDSSTSARLVLNLVGPAGLLTRGVGFNLQAPATVKFGAFANGLAINDTGVYQLLSAGSADPNEPVALVGGVKANNLLTVGIFQKDRNQSAQDSGSALCQIAIEFVVTKGLVAGASLPLQITKAKAIPEDIGTLSDTLFILDRKLKMTDLNIALGSLAAK